MEINKFSTFVLYIDSKILALQNNPFIYKIQFIYTIDETLQFKMAMEMAKDNPKHQQEVARWIDI